MAESDFITPVCKNGRHQRCSGGLFAPSPCACPCHVQAATNADEESALAEKVADQLGRDWGRVEGFLYSLCSIMTGGVELSESVIDAINESGVKAR